MIGGEVRNVRLRPARLWCVAAAVLLWCALSGAAAPAGDGKGDRHAVLLEINDAIGPAVSDYIQRGLVQAREQGAELVIIQMDTPGGLDSAMRDIIQEIISSQVPVVTYVSPSGARAASAGTYISYASHIAAMAPATNLGAATPVQISGFPGGGGGDGGDKEGGRSAMEKKIVNDAVAYIRGLARLRGRNAEWAERAVREGVSLSANEALAQDVIDLVAPDVSELLARIDGRQVNVLGREVTLASRNLIVDRLKPDWRSRLLGVITDPNIAYILMLIGIYGLIYEFANPGMILPGVAGAISLLLALFAFQVLPVSYAGLALMLLGIAFMVGEAFMPSFGALGIGGVIAFVFGSIMLLDTDVPGYGISLPVIGVFAATSAGFFMFVVGMMIRSHRRPVVSGMEELVGAEGEALEDFDGVGRVRVHSESWRARTEQPLRRGDRVRVVSAKGLSLVVQPVAGTRKEEG